jgi:hypothetical protein
MVAGVLHHLGVDMGPSLPPDVYNPLGYFEDARFVAIHRAWSRRLEPSRERRRLRLPPWDPAPGPVDLARYVRLVRACERRPCWGVKDPELCYYAGRFAAMARRPFRVIATARDPVAVAASLSRMWRYFTPTDSITVAEDYARRQTQTLADLVDHGNPPALLVDFDAAIADPEDTVRRIAAHVDRPVTAAAIAFITPDLRHYPMPVAPAARDQGLTTLTT